MRELLLIRGIRGSGKTTLAEMLASFCAAEVFTTDDYFTNPSGQYHWRAEDLKKAHEWNQDRVRNCMIFVQAPLIIVPNTFTRNWEMKPYINMAKDHDYKVTVIRVESGLTPMELHDRNVHSVPYDAILRQWDRMEDFKQQ